MSGPNFVTDLEAPGARTLLNDDSSAIHAGYERKLRSSPWIPRTIADRCIPHSHARGMKSNEDFGWANFWNGELVKRQHGWRTEAIQRCGFHRCRNRDA